MPGSLGAWLLSLGAEPTAHRAPVWPPDAFAVSAAFLRRTGAYATLVNGGQSRQPAGATVAEPVDVGRKWRETLRETLSGSAASQSIRESCPHQVSDWWATFVAKPSLTVTDAATTPSIVAAACALCIASDEACEGMAVRVDEENALFGMAQHLLRHNDQRSLCWKISSETLAVLPKQHTPQIGCTIRSLTHNLALYTAAEIKAYWAGPFLPASGDPDVLNLLLLPWPTEVATGDFRLSGTLRGSRPVTRENDGTRYFEYAPVARDRADVIVRRVRQALGDARNYAERIDGVVFPELALRPDEYFAVEAEVVSSKAMLIAGIRDEGSPDHSGMPLNMCAIQPVALTGAPDRSLRRPNAVWDEMRRVQLKHHRWRLEREQILQYSLGGRLPASRDCWERIYVGQREVHFVTLASWLTLCVLICEDLARQDPVAEVIRAVGPNLVFALLMDGPQIRQRWPARYASVLAEDPGCSVLTMTSLGMSRRSRRRDSDTANQPDRSTTIALWRDAVFGEREIVLEPGQNACVLSLVCRTLPERTIDGRIDDKNAHFPVFAGAQPFTVSAEAQPKQRRRRPTPSPARRR